MRDAKKNEHGQALVETAIIIPILILLIATAVDTGLYLFSGANVESAANALARQIETEPGMTVSQAQLYVEQAYPNLNGATVELGTTERTIESLPDGYKFWDANTATFTSRPSQVAWDKRKVTVRYTGQWIAPIAIVASKITASQRSYTLEGSSTAVMDATFEEW